MTCLSVSTDGSILLSGSHDESVRLWDVKSKQCLRTVPLKGVHGAGHAGTRQGPSASQALTLCYCVPQAQ